MTAGAPMTAERADTETEGSQAMLERSGGTVLRARPATQDHSAAAWRRHAFEQEREQPLGEHTSHVVVKVVRGGARVYSRGHLEVRRRAAPWEQEREHVACVDRFWNGCCPARNNHYQNFRKQQA